MTDVFEILLGDSLVLYDSEAEYATFFGGDFIVELGFSRDAAWLAPAAFDGL